MDVVIVNDYAHVTGGAGQVALSTAAALARAGIRVTLLAAVGPVAQGLISAGVAIRLTDQCDIKSDPIRIRAATQGLWNFRAAEDLARLLSHCDPARAVVHVHSWCKAVSSSVIQAALKMGFHVVVTFHDYFYACPTGGFFNFPKREVCTLRPLSARCIAEHCDRDGYPEKIWRVARQAIQNHFGLAGLHNFITLSDFSEEVLRSFIPKDANVFRVPNPIDVTCDGPTRVRENQEFMAVGRLSTEKGLELFAQAARNLGCKATFVGEGPRRDEIANIYPRARITGWQSRDSVSAHMRRARALVFPSIWYEAQPLVVLEAAAQGIPSIVPDGCAAKESVEDKVTGLHFKSGDAADLQEKIAILQDPSVAEQMGRRAYELYWSRPLTMEKHLAALQSCYHSMLAQRVAAN